MKLHSNTTINAINQFRKCIFKIKKNNQFYFQNLMEKFVIDFNQTKKRKFISYETMNYLKNKVELEIEENNRT